MRVLMVTHELPTIRKPGTIAPVARQIESVRALGVDVEVLEIRGIPKVKFLLALPELGRLARSVDVVHAHYGYCGWVARLQLHRPVIVSFMGSDLLALRDARGNVRLASRLEIGVNRRLARHVDAVVVKSAQMARVIAPVEAHVIPNGVDMQTFCPMPQSTARASLGWPTDRRYILFPGDPARREKGYDLASLVFGEVGTLLGEPVEMVALRGVPADRVPEFINACDVMLMTSLSEGSPNVVKEAMACNLPVVSVPVGDVVDLFDGSQGYSVAQRDAEALARAVVEVLTHRPPVDGRAALQRKRLDAESVARRLVELYTQVLTSRRSRN